MNNYLRGIVLSITPYQESSAMVHFLSKDYGLLRFVLQGFYKPRSKMQSLGLPFSEVTYRTDYKENKLLKVYGGELHQAYTQQHQDYDWLLWMSLISELIIHNYTYYEDDDLYDAILMNMEAVNLKNILVLIAKIINGHGLRPYLEGCVVCNDHRINGFSIEQGGYTCIRHSALKDTYEYLVLLGQLFNRNDIDAKDDDLLKYTILQLVKYLQYHTNIKYNSIELL